MTVHTTSRAVVTKGIEHVPQFGGNVWYVDGGVGIDTNSGSSPGCPFATIGAGFSAMSALGVKKSDVTAVELATKVPPTEPQLTKEPAKTEADLGLETTT